MNNKKMVMVATTAMIVNGRDLSPAIYYQSVLRLRFSFDTTTGTVDASAIPRPN